MVAIIAWIALMLSLVAWIGWNVGGYINYLTDEFKR